MLKYLQENFNKMKILIKKEQTLIILKKQIYVTFLLFTLFFLSCKSGSHDKQSSFIQDSLKNSSNALTENDSLGIITKSLIEYAAYDFYKNQQPLPTAFKNVQIRYVVKSKKEILYILCGEFIAQNKQKNDEWIHFTTILTDPYEQWIGSNSLTYCDQAKTILPTNLDLSKELINKLNSLKQIKSN